MVTERKEKECKSCKGVLPVGEFYKSKAFPDDLDSLCKDCRTKERMKTRRLQRKLR